MSEEHDRTVWIIRQLAEVYTPEGVGIWLLNPHRGLNGERAIDLLERGDYEPVEQLADSLAGQVAT